MIDDKLIHDALERWARSNDGRVFYVGLQKVLMGIPSDNSEGALRENLGRRRFASELMAVMADGLRSETESSDDPNARPIVFTLAHPARANPSGARGARRRVSARPGSDTAGGD